MAMAAGAEAAAAAAALAVGTGMGTSVGMRAGMTSLMGKGVSGGHRAAATGWQTDTVG